MNDNLNTSPLNPLPAVVWLLALPIIAMEIVLGLGSAGFVGGAAATGWRMAAVQHFAFSPDILWWMWDTGRWPAEHLVRFVTYPFVHLSVTHAVFVTVILLALGKMAGEAFRPFAVLTVFFASALVGALAYATLVPRGIALVGGYPAVFGLVGTFTFLLWVRLAAIGANPVRAFSLIGMLMGVRLLFGLLFGGGADWIADFAGFATGFLLSFVLVRGGLARVIARLRER